MNGSMLGYSPDGRLTRSLWIIRFATRFYDRFRHPAQTLVTGLLAVATVESEMGAITSRQLGADSDLDRCLLHHRRRIAER
jgi:hypothetical protein